MPDADPSPAADTEARAARWLTAWDEHDSHRTGTGGDAQGAAWLTREITALRGAQTIEAFTFDRLEPVTCYLDIDGTKIPASRCSTRRRPMRMASPAISARSA